MIGYGRERMPEGPECRRIAEGLAKVISGKKITGVTVLSGRYTKAKISGFSKFVECLPLGVAGAGVHGKFIYLICEKEFSVWNTLGMSGSWKTQKGKHSRVQFDLSDGTSVYFDDMRNFGTLKMVTGKYQLIEKLHSLGPDMLNDDVSNDTFVQQLRKKNEVNICKVLMDQSVIAGVGNYLKADALWATKIHPFASVGDLTDSELCELCENIKRIVRAAYEAGGATIQTFSGVEHEKGNYSSKFLVYNRKTDPLGNPVTKSMTPDGRKTHWSEILQVRGKNETR
jgi:DNA-formamidopyrimidine glycosylase